MLGLPVVAAGEQKRRQPGGLPRPYRADAEAALKSYRQGVRNRVHAAARTP